MDGPHSSFPRTWSRIAFNLGSEADAQLISENLQQRWPASEYPVHIHVFGGADNAGISIRIWNSTGIKETGTAYAGDCDGAENPILEAALEEVQYRMTRLRREGKLRS